MIRKPPVAPLILALSAALSACSSSSGGGSSGRGGDIDGSLTPDSRIVQLDANGTLPDQGIDTGIGSESVSVTRIANGSAFAYQMGRVTGSNTFLGVAGIRPDSAVGAVPTAATAVYSGQYDLSYADRDDFDRNVSGRISLAADFTNRRLSGQADGLVVRGDINGRAVSGTARFRGVDAALTGRIGADRAVGAFAGHTSDAALVGGFIAERERRQP